MLEIREDVVRENEIIVDYYDHAQRVFPNYNDMARLKNFYIVF